MSDIENSIRIVPYGRTEVAARVSQYDIGRTITFYIRKKDGDSYEISGDAICTLYALKPDGNIYSVQTDHDDESVTITTEEQLTCVAGKVLCEIRITEDGVDIGTANFYLVVETSPVEGGTASESVITSISAYIQLASEAAADAQEAVDAAAESESNASDSATLAQSWAVGGTDTRDGEDADNSKYYSEQSQAYYEKTVALYEASSGDTSDTDEDAGTVDTSELESYVTAAETAASNAEAAQTAAETAQLSSENAATLSESWAVGGTDSRDGEDIDNSKYYAEQASNSATAAATSETNAAASESAAADSASAAAESAEAAATSETNAEASAEAAATSASKAASAVESFSGVTSFNSRTGAVEPESGDYSAEQVTYDNTESGLTATDTQTAIDELAGGMTSGAAYAISGANAGYHNCIFRGKDLTDVYTVSELATKVAAADWDDLFIGDYITVSITTDLGGTEEIDLVIASFNYFLNDGDTKTSSPHLLIVPKECFYATSVMNSSATSEGGYYGSYMHQTVLPIYEEALSDALDGHVLSHRRLLTTTVSDDYDSMAGVGLTGASSSCSWSDTGLALMSEQMVYGSMVWSSSAYDAGDAQMQLPLFRMSPGYKIVSNVKNGTARYAWWLSSVASSSSFARCFNYGQASSASAVTACGVRPYFLFG